MHKIGGTRLLSARLGFRSREPKTLQGGQRALASKPTKQSGYNNKADVAALNSNNNNTIRTKQDGSKGGNADRATLPCTSHGLFLVSTPIGNLNDLSRRAKSTLESADTILCEDTRRTSKLLYAIGMEKFHSKLFRADEFALDNPNNLAAWVNEAKARRVAFATDAGTPGISDPGSKLVRACVGKGVPVTPIPGPSAILALIAGSGFSETAFCFRGFFPRRLKEQVEELRAVERSELCRVVVWFESPKRIADTLSLVAATIIDDRSEARVVVAKELTKIHEKFFHGGPIEVRDKVLTEIKLQGELGEWCFAIQFPPLEPHDEEAKEAWHKCLRCLLDTQVPVSEATRKVAEVFNVPKNQVYEAALSLTVRDKKE